MKYEKMSVDNSPSVPLDVCDLDIGTQSIFDRKRIGVRVYLARFQYEPLSAILHTYVYSR